MPAAKLNWKQAIVNHLRQHLACTRSEALRDPHLSLRKIHFSEI